MKFQDGTDGTYGVPGKKFLVRVVFVSSYLSSFLLVMDKSDNVLSDNTKKQSENLTL